MLKKELLELLKDIPEDGDITETIQNVEGLIKPLDINNITIDQYKEILEKNEAIKGYNSSQEDTIRSKAVEHYKANKGKQAIDNAVEEALKNAKSCDDLIILKEEDFFDFQNKIRECIGKKIVEPYTEDKNPVIAEMKRKARRRDKLKAKQAQNNKENGISLYTMLVSICCMGLGISPLNIGEMSYVAIDALVRKYQEKEKYDLDIKSLLAGADSKKVKPQYWIRNFDE